MQIDKQEILEVLRSLGRGEEAQRAEGELPDPVDTDQHAGLLDRYGLNAKDLADKIAAPGGLGGPGGLLGGQGV